jgi:WD40 repeat protein
MISWRAAGLVALLMGCSIDDRSLQVETPPMPGVGVETSTAGVSGATRNGTTTGPAGGMSAALPTAGSGAAGQGSGAENPLPEQSPPMETPAPSPCADGQTACTNGCFDLLADVRSCGGCGVLCASYEICSSGRCLCDRTLTPCVTFDHTVNTPSEQVHNVAAYRDGTRDWVAFFGRSAASGAQIVLYDVPALLDFRRIDVPDTDLQLAFVPTEPSLLYSSNGELFRVPVGGVPEPLPLNGVVWFTLSESGTLLAVWDGTGLTVHDFPSLGVVRQLPVSIEVGNDHERLAVSRDERWLAISALQASNQVELFDLADGSSRLLQASGGPGAFSPTFSPDGRELYVGGEYDDGVVYVFDTTTGAELHRFSFSRFATNAITSVTLVPGYDQLLVAGRLGSLSILDAASGTELWSDGGGLVHRAIFSPDGLHLYSAKGAGLGALDVYRAEGRSALGIE